MSLWWVRVLLKVVGVGAVGGAAMVATQPSGTGPLPPLDPDTGHRRH